MSFTVPTEACQASFQWTGIQNAFACGFPALDPTYLQVQYASAAAAALTFNGGVAGNVLTVNGAVTGGNLGIGSVLSGAGIAAGTKILALGSGAGQAGTYVVSVAQNIAAEAITATAALVTLALGVHYTVALDPATGDATVTPIAMPDNGPGTVTVTRQTPAVQSLQVNYLDNNIADALTVAFDQAEMAIAELKRRTGLLENVAFGSSPSPPPTLNGLTVRPQRSIRTNADLPITINDADLNFDCVADLAPVIPAAALRAGASYTCKSVPGSATQTLTATGADTLEGNATAELRGGQSLTLKPYNDGVNNALGYSVQ